MHTLNSTCRILVLAAAVAATPAIGADSHVCLDADQTLRHVGENAACKAGEQRFILEQKAGRQGGPEGGAFTS